MQYYLCSQYTSLFSLTDDPHLLVWSSKIAKISSLQSPFKHSVFFIYLLTLILNRFILFCYSGWCKIFEQQFRCGLYLQDLNYAFRLMYFIIIFSPYAQYQIRIQICFNSHFIPLLSVFVVSVETVSLLFCGVKSSKICNFSLLLWVSSNTSAILSSTLEDDSPNPSWSFW